MSARNYILSRCPYPSRCRWTLGKGNVRQTAVLREHQGWNEGQEKFSGGDGLVVTEVVEEGKGRKREVIVRLAWHGG